MRIFSTINFIPQQSASPYRATSNPVAVDNRNLYCDKFQHSAPVSANISFRSNVSEGYFLRNLSGIHDPYSGVIILNNKEMNQINQDLANTRTGRERIKYLSQYTESMLPVEHAVFELCEAEIKHDRYLSLQTILTQKQPEALKNLIKEQQLIFNKIDKQIPTLSAENKGKVLSALSKAKTRILLPHDDNNHFRKNRFVDELIRISQDKNIAQIEKNISLLPEDEKTEALNRLYDAERIFLNNPTNANIKGKSPLERIKELQTEFAPETLDEPNEIEPLIEIAKQLPTSKSSINAFITEMADKPDNAIAKRFVSESLGTIEHIIPESKGGVDEAYNFIFATKSRNEERSNMPIKEFLKKYPDIPKHCKQYMKDILKAGGDNKLRNHEWYPYVIKETMREEMGINVDISSYRMSPQKAFKSFPKRLKEKYPKFEKYFTNPQ